MARIEVTDLTKQYDGTRGVEGLTFSVGAQEGFGLLGPDGAGKTTTLRILMGLQSPSGGQVSILDHDIGSHRERTTMKQDVGYLPSDPSFDSTLTGNEILAYHASLKSDERSEELLERFDLESMLDRPTRVYTPEQKRLLATVVAFMHDPGLAVLDEPTAGIDWSTEKRLHGFFHAERDRGTSLLVGSHSISTVCALCDRVGILRNGHLVDRLPTERLPDHGGKIVRFETTDPIGEEIAFEHSYGIEVENTVDDHQTSVRFVYTGPQETLLEQLGEYTLCDLSIEQAPIETILTHWYGVRLGANGGGVRV